MADQEEPMTSHAGWQLPLFGTSTWVLIVSSIVLLYMYNRWRYQYLARLGYPGPKPTPFFGNTLQWMVHKNGIYGYHDQMFSKYGKVFGSYAGFRPVLLIADADLVRQICIKDFSSFTNHKQIPIENKPFGKALSALRDDHWKGVRGILSPTFSGSKMKMMMPLINGCLDPLIRKVTKYHQEGKSLELKEIYGRYVIDAIGTSSFGLTISCQERDDDPFFLKAKDIFKVRINLAILCLIFAPFLGPIFNYFNITMFDRPTLNFFENMMDQAIEIRTSGAKKRVDFLQLMLDVQERTDEDRAEATEEEKLEEEHLKKMSKKTLTREEIQSQGLVFFLAGFETSATTLSFASYLLATNPDIQDKLIAEIDDVAPQRDDVTYENLTKMTYLDCVVCETLRIYPVAIFTDRETGKEYTYEGRTVPKGTEIIFSIWNIHHNPEYWENPETFNPDRFLPGQREKHHPCAWIPFGTGPRNCIGMRFAMLQMKLGLVRMLQNFRLKTCEETEIPPVLGKFGFLSPPNGVKLAVDPRS